ncbi:SCP2 sterol-binding domain-containing protein [Shewanella corallii]|uniref:Ubiquinone biosynthesis accessory factor UbiJ n=1 Tax=Shewanella corallii TaxID=560080 RepID=A0ABT0N1H6_9GAMM|nr:SCP2 sterol-binding domain-containing protein [Shewanella corallii]MCL2912210.1 SCP2 sterol-binding domain-containing protein [Shewanella corallii]
MLQREWPLLVCAAAESGINRMIQQAPAEYARAQLDGKSVTMELTQLSFPLTLIFSGQRAQVLSRYEGDVSVSVKADAATLIKLGEGAQLTELIKQDKLSLDGDLATLQALSQFLQQNPLDFAEPISHYLGDAPTHKLFETLKSGQMFALKVLQGTRDHLSELATEEYRIAPGRLEYLHFKDRLEDLCRDVDNIDTRIQQLTDKVKP